MLGALTTVQPHSKVGMRLNKNLCPQESVVHDAHALSKLIIRHTWKNGDSLTLLSPPKETHNRFNDVAICHTVLCVKGSLSHIVCGPHDANKTLQATE